MNGSNTTTREISLGDDFGNVAVKVNGIRINFNAHGGIDVYGNIPVTLHPAANDTPDVNHKPALLIGDTMPDGMKYAGISPDTGTAFYVDAADAPGTYTFDQAIEYAASHCRGPRPRLPTTEELNVLFNNRAAIGGFDQTGSDPTGWYWSSTHASLFIARAQNFRDGKQFSVYRDLGASLRLVRD